MNTEAILFVGNLAQSEYIKTILFSKTDFQFNWVDGQTTHPYDQNGIDSFMKMLSVHEGDFDE